MKLSAIREHGKHWKIMAVKAAALRERVGNFYEDQGRPRMFTRKRPIVNRRLTGYDDIDEEENWHFDYCERGGGIDFSAMNAPAEPPNPPGCSCGKCWACTGGSHGHDW